MIGKSIKNFFVHLKFLFTPLGTLALGVALGLSVLVPGVMHAVQDLAATVAEITGNVEFDFEALWGCLVDAVTALDWNDPSVALGTLTDGGWLSTTLGNCIQSLIPNSEVFAEELGVAVVATVASIAVGFVALILCTLLGMIGGHFLTKFLVRRSMARRAWWKYFLVVLLDGVLSLGVLLAVLWLYALWTPSLIFSAVFVLLLLCCCSLIEAYIVHGWKKTDWKRIINIGNVCKLLLSNVIVFAITVAMIFVGLLLFGSVAGSLLAFAFLEIMACVAGLNAEAYVKDVVADGEQGLPLQGI